MLRKIIFLILFLNFFGKNFSSGQTTYTWIGASGGSWAVSTNWSPNRAAPAANDVILFNSGTALSVTTVPTQTIGQLIVNTNTDVSLQSSAAVTLSINGPTLTNNLQVAAGSTLQLSSTLATSINLTIVTTASQRGDISGSLILNTNTSFNNTLTSSAVATTIVTVASGGGITNNGGAITSSAATLVFANGSAYNHARNGGTIPTATYNATSTVNITGITSTNLTTFTGTYGNVIWNCASQTVTGAITGAITVNGNLQIVAGTLTLNGFTINAKSDVINDGTITSTAVGSRITMNGTVTQTISGAGTWTTAAAGRLLNLTVNNTSGLNPAVNLNVNVAVQTSLNLTAGILGGTGTLTIGIPATAVTTTRTAGSLVNVPAWGYTTGAYAITYNGGAAINTGNELPPSATPANGILTVSIANTNVTLTADANIGRITTSVAATTTFNLNGFTLGLSDVTPVSNTGVINASAGTSTIKFNGTVAQTFTLAGTYTSSIISNMIIDNSNVATGVSLGTTNVNVGNLTTNPSRILTIAGLNINVLNDLLNDGTITSTAVGSRITMNGTVAQTISGAGAWTTGTAGRLLNLTVNNTSGLNPAVNLNVNVAIQTSLNLTAGVLGGTGTLTIGITATAVTTTRTAGSLANVPAWGYTTGAYAITYNGGAAINTGNELPPSATPTNGILTVSIANTNVTLTADANIGRITTSVAATTTFNLNGFILGLSNATPVSNTGVINASAGTSTIKFNGTVAQTFILAGTYTSSIISNMIIDNTNVATGVSLGTTNVNVGNLTINPSRILTLAGLNINVLNDLLNDGTITSTAVGSRITMNGTVAQTISGAGTWTTGTAGRLLNFTINNTSGLNPAVNLNVNVAVQTSLNLTAGILGGTGTLTMGIGAASTLTMTRILGALANTPTFNLTGVTFNAVYGNGVAVSLITTGTEIPYSPSTISNFTVNNPTNGVALSNSVTLSGSPGLTLTSGNLFLGNNNATLTSTAAGAISGGSATTFVVADATGGNTGQLIRATSGAVTYAFPISDATGTVEYSPVSLAFTVNATPRNIGVKVTDVQHPNDGTVTDYISRYWTFSDNNAGVGTYTYTPTFTFLNPADLTGTYANLFLNRWDGSVWTQFTNSGVSPNLVAAALTETTGTLGGNDFTGRVNIATYTWNQTATASWAVAGNWTPARIVPSTTDILLFNNGATTIATNVPTQTIRQLLVSAATNVSLQSAAAVTLSIKGPTLTNNLQIAAGSTLQLSSTLASSINMTIITTASQRGDISGSFILNTNTSNNNTLTTTAVATTIVTVANGGSIVNNGGVVTASAATLVFSAGATYSHTMNSGTVPAATWTNSSPYPTVDITSSTTGPTAGLNQTFGNFTLNTGAAVITTLTGATQTNGTLTLTNGIFSIGANTLTLNGDLSTGSGSLRGGTTSNLSVTGTTAALTLPAITNNLQNLTVNRANGVVLGAPLSLSTTGILTLTSGNLTTTSVNILTVNNTTAGGVSGGSSSSYVNGPLARAFPASLGTGSTYTFPIGKSVYNLFELVNPTTNAAGTVTAEVFDANSGGTAGFGLASLNTNRYWQATASSAFMTSSTVRFTEPALGGANRVGQSSTSGGTYVARGGSAPSPVLSGPVSPSLDYFVLCTNGVINLSGTYTVGNTGQFLNLTNVANILNTSTVTGNVIFEFQPDYDGTVGETYPIIFYQYTTSGGGWTATVRPASGVSLRTTSGTTSSLGLITLSGIDKITFDGRAGGSGSAVAWKIQNNTNGSAYPVFDFIDGASNNMLEYLTVIGSCTNTTGTILLGTSTIAGGNSNNTIQYCNIGNYSSYQYNGILASGSASPNANSNNSVLNNNIYNFQGLAGSYPTSGQGGMQTNAAVNITNGSGGNWTISGNSIYAATIPAGSSFVAGISFNAGSASTGNTVSGNYIGGNSALAAGTMSYKGHRGYNDINPQDFTGIYASSGGTVTVSNNVIRNINLDNTTGSNVGSQTFCGINVNGTSVTAVYNVTGNFIGDTATCASIHAGQYGTMLGILNSSRGPATIDGNMVCNLTSDAAWPNGTYTYDGIIGIMTYTAGQIGDNTITNNVVSGLISANNYRNNLYLPIPAGGSSYNTSPIYNMIIIGGIVLNTSYSETHTHSISNNQVYNLQINMTGGTNKAYIEGIVAKAGPYGTTTIDGNLVYNLYYPDGFGGAGNYGGLVGIDLPSGNGSSPGANYYVQNNIISLGLKPDGTTVKNVYIFGIWDDNTSNNTGWLRYYIYNNSVYIGGTNDNTGSNNLNSYGIARYFNWSSAQYEALTIKNNVIVNNRTTTAGSGKNYGIYLLNYNSTVNVTSDYNLVYGTGTNFYFGSAGNNTINVDYATLAAWSATPAPVSGTGFDANGKSVDPLYVSPAASPPDLHITSGSPAINSGTNVGVTNDYDETSRSSPDIGADEYAASYSQFTWVSKCGAGYSTPLPVELLSLSGKIINRQPHLFWSTASEVNNDYFTVERSLDAKDFESIGIVKGAGNSSAILNYEFVDTEFPMFAAAAVFYYRLKQTDYDGRYDYSGIIVLSLSETKTISVIITPNPVSDYLAITLQGIKESSVCTIRLIDMHGMEAMNKKFLLKPGISNMNIRISEMNSGIYSLILTLNTEKSDETILRKIFIY